MSLRTCHLSALMCAGVLLAGNAGATDEPAAAALFDRALAAMEAERYDEACPAFAESYRLDPRMGALFTLAECEAKWGKNASAIAYYEEYLSRFARLPPDQQVAQRGRDKIAQHQRDALHLKVPRLTLRVNGELGPGRVVKRDGVALGAPSIGVAVPVDPGTHEATIEDASGHVLARRSIAVEGGESSTVTLDAPPVDARDGAEAPPTPTPTPRTPTVIGVGIVGLAGVAVGTVFGILTIAKKDVIDNNCVDVHCNHDGKQAADAAKDLALASTIGFVIGAVSLSAAGVLFFTDPARRSSTAWSPRLHVGKASASVGIERAW